jgi:site-specific DNA-methyltransferase (adenine-specific)
MVIIHGNSLDELKNLTDNSVDSIVTDPPYELGLLGKKWDSTGIAYNIELWKECLRVLKPGGHLLTFGGTRTYHRMTVAIEDAGFEIRDSLAWIYGSGFPKSRTLEDGWGTALKPALEPIVMARKPLGEKTVAANILKWGTGGINIDATRIGTAERHPANILFDEDASIFLDEQTKGKITQGHWAKTKVTGFGEYGGGSSEYLGVGRKAEEKGGGASRFFYVAKVSKSERNKGLNTPVENNHPTVKPIALMRYLVRLVTPTNGIVLDPFTGSGSTGVACIEEGFDFIGIEMTDEYIPIIKARLGIND